MPVEFQGREPIQYPRARGGPSYHLARRLGLEPPTPSRRLLKVSLLILITWVPLLVLSLLQGHAVRGRADIPLLHDPIVYSRFLFVVPLLELAQIAVETGLAAQMQQFLRVGIVPEHQRQQFESAQDAVVRLRGSVVAEVLILVLAATTSIVMRSVARYGTSDSTWERLGTTITPAGWWYILVSVPILAFLLIRWLWVFLLWAWFLFRVSRLELELTPTHADHAGGLGFLGWGLASFAPVLMAVSAVLSGSLAGEILHRGSSLDQLKYHVIVFVVLAIVIVHAPLLVFTGRLGRCRFRALLDFGELIFRHDRAFDEKWVRASTTSQERLLGSPDLTSLAGMAEAFEHVDRMQLIPLDKKALIVLVVAALIPMIPLVGTSIPFTEILAKLGEFMV